MIFGTSVHALTDWSAQVKPFRTVLAEAAELGFGSIMLMHLPGQAALTATSDPQGAMIDLETSDLSLVRQVVHDAGLEVSCLYQGLTKVATDKECEETVAGMLRLADMAGELGTDILLPNAGVAPAPQMPSEAKGDLIGRLAKVFTRVLEGTPPTIRIAPDIHYQGILETVADCRRLFELVPDTRAGITLNIGHMTTLREEGWTLLQDHPERVHVVAWKDHLLAPPEDHPHAVYSVELGTGDSPFDKYARLIAEDGGHHAHLITFEHVPLAEKAPALGRSLQYMRELWAATH